MLAHHGFRTGAVMMPQGVSNGLMLRDENVEGCRAGKREKTHPVGLCPCALNNANSVIAFNNSGDLTMERFVQQVKTPGNHPLPPPPSAR